MDRDDDKLTDEQVERVMRFLFSGIPSTTRDNGDGTSTTIYGRAKTGMRELGDDRVDWPEFLDA